MEIRHGSRRLRNGGHIRWVCGGGVSAAAEQLIQFAVRWWMEIRHEQLHDRAAESDETEPIC
jgi:hypothetical protein